MERTQWVYVSWYFMLSVWYKVNGWWYSHCLLDPVSDLGRGCA